MISSWFQLFVENQIMCMSLPCMCCSREILCSGVCSFAPHGCMLMKENNGESF
jgi:hypothetical protein